MRRRRDRGQRGSILVELALVVPFLVLIALGMLEMGLAWRDSITVTQATRQGARVGSNLGDLATADQQALINLMAVLDDDERDKVEFVVIYDASVDFEVPASCLVSSQNSGGIKCNHYDVGALAQINQDNKWGCGGGDNDATWCPTTRSNSLGNPDHLGIFVQMDRPWVTGIFPGDGITLDAYTVMRLEPEPS